jgi:hypothetical protein
MSVPTMTVNFQQYYDVRFLKDQQVTFWMLETRMKGDGGVDRTPHVKF